MNDKVYAEYQSRWYQPGTSFYYASLPLPAVQRDALVHLHVLYRELQSVANDYSEISIGMTRLQWWQEEIARLTQGEARHPISQAMQTTLAQTQVDTTPLESLVNAIAVYFDAAPIQTWEQFSLVATHTEGSVLAMQLALLGVDPKPQQHWLAPLSQALFGIERLRELASDLQRQHFFLPLSLLNEGDSDSHWQIEDVKPQLAQPEIQRQLVQQTCDYIARQLNQGLAGLNAARAKRDMTNQTHRFFQTRIMLAWKLLEAIVQDHQSLSRSRISLTPLRKLMISWRSFWRCVLHHPLASFHPPKITD